MTMSARGLLVLLGGWALACTSAVAVAAEDQQQQQPQQQGGKWTPLFDGKTLDGWHHFGEGRWVVEDGAIVGKTDKAAKLYSLLISDGVFHDFTVRFKFKSIQGNSGFYVRVVTEDPDKAHGLQIEVDPRKNPGGIYESYRRAWVSRPTEEQVKSYFKPDEWNDVTIAAYGGNVKVTVNGVTSAALKDDPSRPAGQLAMQMHSGNEMLVMFKDIEVQAVPRAGEDKRGPTSPQKVTQDAAAGGAIVLPAKHAKLTGPGLAYMPEWDALGFWKSTDHAEWQAEVTKAGTYDVMMEWSVADDNAGNPFTLSAGDQRLEATVPSTKRWDLFRVQKIGQIKLEPGVHTLTLKPAGEFKTALMDLRELRLIPSKAK